MTHLWLPSEHVKIRQYSVAGTQAERDEKRRTKEKRAIGQKRLLALPFYGGDQS